MQKILLLVCVILYTCIYTKHHAYKELSINPVGLIYKQTAIKTKVIYNCSREILKTIKPNVQQNDIGSWNIKDCNGFKLIHS